jgi:hypothetical protein
MVMKRDFKIRFNLSKGANFMKWKIEYDDRVEYLDPAHTQLIMFNCVLHNNEKTAQKIHSGENKSVCAWIKCGGMLVIYDKNVYEDTGEEICYNPRVKPFWRRGDANVDGNEFKTIYSDGYKLFAA